MTTEPDVDGQIPATLTAFTNEVLPLERKGKSPTWQPRAVAIRSWVSAVERNPAAVQVTPTERLKVTYHAAGMIRVTGTISVNLATAATVALIEEAGDAEGLDL